MSVYFAKAGRYTKVGYSANPLSRVSTVTTNGTRPADLPRAADAELIGWIPGDLFRETQMHRRFAADRVEGEWFVLDEPLVRDLIWSDPGGVDIERMSAQAVFVMLRNPLAIRDDLAAADIPIEAVDIDVALANLFAARPQRDLGESA